MKKHFFRRQVLPRILLYGGLLAGILGALVLRCCPHWHGVEMIPPVSEMPERPWINPDGMTQETRILPPAGCTRVPAAAGSFAAYMRAQPMYPDGSAVCAYDGTVVSANNAAAVYALSVGDEGWQQCADTIIRFWAEYFRASGQPERLAFHLSNGFLCDYAAWTRGRRVLAFGDFACWIPIGRRGDSAQTFHNWLKTVMQFAGTLSLEAESVPIPIGEAHAGDILCHGGAPGHAVLIADEAADADGNRYFLLAQGFIPAQLAHVITGYAPDGNPWYSEAELSAETVYLSSYVFRGDALRRWNGGVS